MMVVMAMVMTAMTVIMTGVGVVTVCRGLAQWAAPGGTGLRGDAGSTGSVKVRKSMVGALPLPPRR
ncbi:hypothetical protein D3C76_1588160 [compost metagenome]